MSTTLMTIIVVGIVVLGTAVYLLIEKLIDKGVDKVFDKGEQAYRNHKAKKWNQAHAGQTQNLADRYRRNTPPPADYYNPNTSKSYAANGFDNPGPNGMGRQPNPQQGPNGYAPDNSGAGVPNGGVPLAQRYGRNAPQNPAPNGYGQPGQGPGRDYPPQGNAGNNMNPAERYSAGNAPQAQPVNGGENTADAQNPNPAGPPRRRRRYNPEQNDTEAAGEKTE